MTTQIRKYLWFDSATTSLDPSVSSFLEIAYVKENNLNDRNEIQHIKTQPILHYEDHLYGKIPLEDFCSRHNKRYHEADPKRVIPFAFKNGSPLFMYTKESLTFNRPVPEITDPSQWILDKERLSAKRALNDLIKYVTEGHENDDPKHKWILVGHNISYDLEVLKYWAVRLLGHEDADKLLFSKINKYIYLDTLQLTRWMQYIGRVNVDSAKLEHVAHYLGIDTHDIHTARGDLRIVREMTNLVLKSTMAQWLEGIF